MAPGSIDIIPVKEFSTFLRNLPRDSSVEPHDDEKEENPANDLANLLGRICTLNNQLLTHQNDIELSNEQKQQLEESNTRLTQWQRFLAFIGPAMSLVGWLNEHGAYAFLGPLRQWIARGIEAVGGNILLERQSWNLATVHAHHLVPWLHALQGIGQGLTALAAFVQLFLVYCNAKALSKCEKDYQSIVTKEREEVVRRVDNAKIAVTLYWSYLESLPEIQDVCEWRPCEVRELIDRIDNCKNAINRAQSALEVYKIKLLKLKYEAEVVHERAERNWWTSMCFVISGCVSLVLVPLTGGAIVPIGLLVGGGVTLLCGGVGAYWSKKQFDRAEELLTKIRSLEKESDIANSDMIDCLTQLDEIKNKLKRQLPEEAVDEWGMVVEEFRRRRRQATQLDIV